jgi:hypothetical protein
MQCVDVVPHNVAIDSSGNIYMIDAGKFALAEVPSAAPTPFKIAPAKPTVISAGTSLQNLISLCTSVYDMIWVDIM